MGQPHARGALSRIGIIGDVHQCDRALESCLSFLHAQGAARILCTGDIPDGVGDVERCVQLLEHYDVVCVRGNHGRWLLDGTMRDMDEALPPERASSHVLEYIDALPVTSELDTSAGTLLLCHGLGSNDLAQVHASDLPLQLESNRDLQRVLNQGFRFVVNGHTHQRMVLHLGTTTLINAGTLDPRHRPCCALLDLRDGLVRFFDLDATRVHAAETHSIWGAPASSRPSATVRDVVRNLRVELPKF